MSMPQTMDEVMARIERSIQRVVELITALSPAQMLEPHLSDGWSVKDILAHLAWWDRWLLVTLPPDGNDPQPVSTPPLFDQIPTTDHWADEMNGKVYAYNKARDLDDIRADFDATRRALIRRVSQMTHDDLYDPAGMSQTIGQPVAPLILGIYEHYEEHAHELEKAFGKHPA